ncbi:MAG: hypothetical protein AB1601_09350 [Planctomycetota bacterium]
MTRRDLHEALDLPENNRVACSEALAEYCLAKTRSARDGIIDRLELETGLPGLRLERALRIMYFFVDEFMDERDRGTPEDWAADLVEMDVISESERGTFLSILADLQTKVVPRIEKVMRRRRFGAGVMPSLKSTGVTVELRAVQESTYRWGKSLTEYQPKISGVTGVFSIEIGVTGDREPFAFQCDEEEINLLIDQFTAAKTDLAALKEFLKIADTESASSETPEAE